MKRVFLSFFHTITVLACLLNSRKHNGIVVHLWIYRFMIVGLIN